MQLEFVRFGRVKDLDVRIFHSYGEPFVVRTITERKYLRREVVLLQLSTLPKIPGTYRVVEAARPEFRAVRGYVDAGGTVRVTLKLSDQRLIL